MPENFEKLIKLAYKKWRAGQPKLKEPHPDEETLVSFLENRLSAQECERIKIHLINCNHCSEIVAACLSLETAEIKEIPQELLIKVKGLVKQEEKISILEICVRLKENFLEILSTTGDVLVGQELVPAVVLRSRKIKDFRDEVTILKDFKDITVEVKIVNKKAQAFSLTAVAKEKATQKIIKDLRVTLIKEDVELESYLTSSGKVTFEHILLGKYTVEISNIENKLASILIDIKV